MTHSEETAFEVMIDRLGLSAVLSRMADICIEKSDHVWATCQDLGLTRAWGRASPRAPK